MGRKPEETAEAASGRRAIYIEDDVFNGTFQLFAAELSGNLVEFLMLYYFVVATGHQLETTYTPEKKIYFPSRQSVVRFHAELRQMRKETSARKRS
ncbi:hypothetical protein RUM44_008548 [Polyplax serrata]|uniref:Uncharacterized protein n=1 Tax=Polyplax serrata TaxID=468196 RepID=A0ABR1B8J7_POLSC